MIFIDLLAASSEDESIVGSESHAVTVRDQCHQQHRSAFHCRLPFISAKGPVGPVSTMLARLSNMPISKAETATTNQRSPYHAQPECSPDRGTGLLCSTRCSADNL